MNDNDLDNYANLVNPNERDYSEILPDSITPVPPIEWMDDRAFAVCGGWNRVKDRSTGEYVQVKCKRPGLAKCKGQGEILCRKCYNRQYQRIKYANARAMKRANVLEGRRLVKEVKEQFDGPPRGRRTGGHKLFHARVQENVIIFERNISHAQGGALMSILIHRYVKIADCDDSYHSLIEMGYIVPRFKWVARYGEEVAVYMLTPLARDVINWFNKRDDIGNRGVVTEGGEMKETGENADGAEVVMIP